MRDIGENTEIGWTEGISRDEKYSRKGSWTSWLQIKKHMKRCTGVDSFQRVQKISRTEECLF